MFMMVLSSVTVGWVAFTTGLAGLLGLVFIILLFTLGQPFGTLNDICVGLTAILSGVLAWLLYPGQRAQSPLLSQVLLVVAIAGVLLVLVGSVRAVSGLSGWFLSGLYMAAGNGLIGLWLLGLSYSDLKSNSLPPGLVTLGFISGIILTLGLVTVPGILRGKDTKEYERTTVNYIWWTSALGWLALFPIWCILLGSNLLSQSSIIG
jgi:hypothetical protein